MKQTILAALILTNTAYKQCSRIRVPVVPACIQAKIDAIKKEPTWNPPATVTEYRYNGKRVFLFSSNCCDQYDEVVDESCNAVCAPGGGITGKGDRKCPDFNAKAELVKVVWKDERAK